MIQGTTVCLCPAHDESLRDMLKDERLQKEIRGIDAASDREKVNQYSFVCFVVPCVTFLSLAASCLLIHRPRWCTTVHAA